jgi:hypothetical protein
MAVARNQARLLPQAVPQRMTWRRHPVSILWVATAVETGAADPWVDVAVLSVASAEVLRLGL